MLGVRGGWRRDYRAGQSADLRGPTLFIWRFPPAGIRIRATLPALSRSCETQGHGCPARTPRRPWRAVKRYRMGRSTPRGRWARMPLVALVVRGLRREHFFAEAPYLGWLGPSGSFRAYRRFGPRAADQRLTVSWSRTSSAGVSPESSSRSSGARMSLPVMRESRRLCRASSLLLAAKNFLARRDVPLSLGGAISSRHAGMITDPSTGRALDSPGSSPPLRC
jgi:hypothetical protein